jgi:hypothetical protein
VYITPDRSIRCTLRQAAQSGAHYTRPLNPVHITPGRSIRTSLLPAGTFKQEMSFNPFPGKAEIKRRSNFEKLMSCLFIKAYIAYIALRY